MCMGRGLPTSLAAWSGARARALAVGRAAGSRSRRSSGKAGAKWSDWPRMLSAMHSALTIASSVHSTTAS